MTRPPVLPLILLYLVPFVVAALTPESAFVGAQGDVNRYYAVGASVLNGATPYSEVTLEYPPFALAPMILPILLWPFGEPTFTTYVWLFAGQQAFLLVILGLVLGRVVALGGAAKGAAEGAPDSVASAVAADSVARDVAEMRRRQRAVAWRLLALVLGAALAVTWRFDLFPTLLALVGLWAALARFPVGAGAAIGAGMLAKLFPVVIGPVLALIWLVPIDRDRQLRFAVAGATVLIAGMVPFLGLAGLDAFAFVGYQADRGLQIESVGGGLVLLLGLITGDPNRLTSPFSAWEVTGTAARVFLVLSTAALIAGLGWLALLGWRRARADAAGSGSVAAASVVGLASAAIFLLVLTSKVFSIQYVVWLLPFAALLPGRQFWLAAAAVALTMPIHPFLYEALVRQEALPILVLNLRNGLLAALFAWLVWSLATSRPSTDVTSQGATT